MRNRLAPQLRLLVAIVCIMLTVAATSCRKKGSTTDNSSGGTVADQTSNGRTSSSSPSGGQTSSSQPSNGQASSDQPSSGSGASSQSDAPASSDPDTHDPLATTKAAYSKLTSYADTATVVHEFPGVIARSRFKTFYRRTPLDFFFEYQALNEENPKIKGSVLDLTRRRVVMWMRNGELRKWQQETGALETFPATSNQTSALSDSFALSNGTSVLIPGLIFGKSKLNTVIQQIDEAADAGMEDVDGHPCRKIIGTAADYYATGRRVNVRQVTVWVDRDTQLIRRVFEDTPTTATADTYNRLTVTIDPQLNPTLEDTNFEFQVPSKKQ